MLPARISRYHGVSEWRRGSRGGLMGAVSYGDFQKGAPEMLGGAADMRNESLRMTAEWARHDCRGFMCDFLRPRCPTPARSHG